MKQQYKEYLKLNKNILLGFSASIVISAIVAQLFSNQQNYINATITSIVDYVVYFSTFGGLFYKKEANITNNQAEYMAIISVLKKFQGFTDEMVIYSDSKNTVSQLNHDYAINNSQLRSLAMEAWELMAKYPNLKIKWIPRNENLAGKMLGS